MQYFEFYDLPVSFLIDEGLLRKKFVQKSKEFHPDFHTLASDEKQAEILELSTLNNEAYKTLSDADKRMQYILQQKDLLGEDNKNQLPQAFLMEMMDINEKLMTLEMDFDETVYQQLQTLLQQKESEMYKVVKDALESYQEENASADRLHKIRDYYLQKRYLIRIKENLAKLKKS